MGTSEPTSIAHQGVVIDMRLTLLWYIHACIPVHDWLVGFVCSRSQQDKTKRGCCNESDTTLPRVKQFSCDKCDTNPPHCCEVFEHCVSCCMHPLNVRIVSCSVYTLCSLSILNFRLTSVMLPQENIRREYLTHADPSHPVYGDTNTLTVFRYCKFRCRTSSASVQHQNSYRR